MFHWYHNMNRYVDQAKSEIDKLDESDKSLFDEQKK